MGSEIRQLISVLLNTRNGVEDFDVKIVDELNMQALETAFAVLFDLEQKMKERTSNARLYPHPSEPYVGTLY